jgi:hypothetical protein
LALLAMLVITLALGTLTIPLAIDAQQPNADADECLSATLNGTPVPAGCHSPEADNVLETTVITQVHKLEASCPSPTRKSGSQCVLDSDVTLTATLRLDPFTHLNCRSHKILPSSPATASQGSIPGIAIVLVEAYGTKIQNCVIGEDDTRFSDYGILLLKSKIAEDLKNDPSAVSSLRNQILSNEIHAWFRGISVVKSDSTQISDNIVTYNSRQFNGIDVFTDSNENLITNNLVISKGRVDVGPNDHTIGLFAYGPQDLINVVIGDTLVQVPLATQDENGEWHIHAGGTNLVEGNILIHEGLVPVVTGGATAAGVFIAQGGESNRIIGNTITGGAVGVQMAGSGSAGLVFGGTAPVEHPGTCKTAEGAETGRLCVTNVDCNIPGLDPGPIGTCSGVGQIIVVNGFPTDNLIQDNILPGPYAPSIGGGSRGILVSQNQLGAIIKDNRIGVQGMNQDFVGISLAGKALETVTVERNSITGTSLGIRFAQNATTPFTFIGAKIALNDIFQNTQNVGIVGTYTTLTELSVNGRGNYWGHRCNEDGGFIEAGKANADSASAFLVDSHPYGRSVATTPGKLLPATCP